MTPPVPDPSSFLPLRPLELLVLAMLAEQQRHGYAIREAILEHSGGRLEVEAGHLYRQIRRLDEHGLIEESDYRPPVDADDERRRYYALTPLGRRVLAAELSRLRALVRWGEALRVIPPLRP